MNATGAIVWKDGVCAAVGAMVTAIAAAESRIFFMGLGTRKRLGSGYGNDARIAIAAPREIGTFSKLPVFAIGKGLQPCGSIQLRAVPLFKRAASHSNVASRIPSVSNSFTVAST